MRAEGRGIWRSGKWWFARKRRRTANGRRSRNARRCRSPALAIFLVPAASLGFGFPALLSYQFLFGLSATVWAISMTTTQQLITPPELQGRVAGVLQAALIGTVPIGALGGGALASWLGSIPVLTGGATVALQAAACLWLPNRTPGMRHGAGIRQGPLQNGP
ncbi:hypothetical protein ACFRQM_17015 [Streptomyces sp. NPDC056831]|uniref:hypothetical protein n=1 Tax=Streptomyces sp. NPDC056831 TaxID=3345954 RepID=UPI0036B29410